MNQQRTNVKMRRLTEAMSSVIDDYMMVSFACLDPTDEDSIEDVLARTDHAVQYGEDLEPREPNFAEEGEEFEGRDIAPGDYDFENM